MKFGICGHLAEMTLEEEAPVLQKHGFSGWEISLPTLELRKKRRTMGSLLEEARRLRTIGEGSGIEATAVGVMLTPRHVTADIGYVRQVFELVRETGSTGVRMSGVHYNDPPPPEDYLAEHVDDVVASYHQGTTRFHDFFAEQRDLLYQLAEEAGKHGVRLLLEIHPYFIHNSPSAMLRLIEHCAPAHVGVLLDPQGLSMQGHEGSKQSVDVLRHYLAHMHVKDSFLEKTAEGKRRHVQTALWEGTTQWPLLVATLKWIGFDGYWLDEDFRGVGIEARVQTKQYLERLWAEAPPEPDPAFCLKTFRDHFA